MLQTLNRPAGESPAVTEVVLGRIGKLDEHWREATALQGRIDDMRSDLAAFEGRVSAVAERLGQPPLGTIFETAHALVSRRQRAQILAATGGRGGRGVEGRDQARGRRCKRGQGCLPRRSWPWSPRAAPRTPKTAERRLTVSAERLRREAERDKAAQRLQEVGGGAAYDRLAAEATALPASHFTAERDEAEAVLARAHADGKAIAVELAELERCYRSRCRRHGGDRGRGNRSRCCCRNWPAAGRLPGLARRLADAGTRAGPRGGERRTNWGAADRRGV